MAKGHTIVVISPVIVIPLKDFFDGTVPSEIINKKEDKEASCTICFEVRISRKGNRIFERTVLSKTSVKVIGKIYKSVPEGMVQEIQIKLSINQ